MFGEKTVTEISLSMTDFDIAVAHYLSDNNLPLATIDNYWAGAAFRLIIVPLRYACLASGDHSDIRPPKKKRGNSLD